MTSAAIPSLAPLLEASPAILRLAIPRLAPIVATALLPELAIPLLVVGTSYAAFQALYYWQKSQNDALQAKAKAKYCALNSGDPDCGEATFTGGQSPVLYKFGYDSQFAGTGYLLIGPYNPQDLEMIGPITSITYLDYNPNTGRRRFSVSNQSETKFGFAYYGGDDGTGVRPAPNPARTDNQPDTGGNAPTAGGNSFSNWSANKQQTALQQLNDNDWREVIASTSARQLQEGETINQPVILSGNPDSTIPGERIPNVINFPGTVPAAG